MSMSDHIKQQILQEFFAKKVSFSWKTAKLDSSVLPEWENQHTYQKFLPIWSRANVAHCFNLFHNVRYRTTEEQPQIGDRGSYPVAINQFLIFFLYWVHVFSFSFFIC